MKPLRPESYGLSDIGLKRKNNEDVFVEMHDAQFYALADGMGGHLAGEIAARLAVDHVCSLFLPPPSADSAAILDSLARAMQASNRHVFETAGRNVHWEGMGTTLTCLYLHAHHMYYAHVGDSRIYRFRNVLEQITRDHSVSQELLLHRSTITSGKVARHRHAITRAIGTSLKLDPEIGMCETLPEDMYLLCSDGLTDQVSDQEILSIFTKMRHNPVSSLSVALIEAAKSRGGKDNITVIVVKVY